MFYTIGYQGMKSIEELFSVIKPISPGVLIDVRSKPYGRLATFNKSKLEPACSARGLRYEWRGETLGGFSAISDAAIAELANRENETIVLLCMERDPNQCHRFYEIGKRLRANHGIGSIHLMFIKGVPHSITL